MRFFFFGSLLDADVAELVLGRRLPARAWEPAALDGYARAIFAKEPYPVLVPRPGGHVEGAIVRGLSAEDHGRITWFEEGEYDIEVLPVALATGKRLEAHACVTRAHVPHRPGDWSLARWQREDKPAFMALAELWMSLHGRVSITEAEARWDDLKTRLADSPTANLRARRGS